MTTDRTMPWKVGESLYGCVAIVPAATGTMLADGATCRPVEICRMGVGFHRTETEALAYAHRIVACVAACQGIPTEDLLQLVELAGTDAARLAALSLTAQYSMREAELTLTRSPS